MSSDLLGSYSCATVRAYPDSLFTTHGVAPVPVGRNDVETLINTKGNAETPYFCTCLLVSFRYEGLKRESDAPPMRSQSEQFPLLYSSRTKC